MTPYAKTGKFPSSSQGHNSAPLSAAQVCLEPFVKFTRLFTPSLLRAVSGFLLYLPYNIGDLLWSTTAALMRLTCELESLREQHNLSVCNNTSFVQHTIFPSVIEKNQGGSRHRSPGYFYKAW